jgi:hypothetical protein
MAVCKVTPKRRGRWVGISIISFQHSLPVPESDPFFSTRTVRTLSSSPASSHVQSQGTTLQPARINNFLANALKLQGKSKKISPRASRWERRPCTSCIMPGEWSSLTMSRAILKLT